MYPTAQKNTLRSAPRPPSKPVRLKVADVQVKEWNGGPEGGLTDSDSDTEYESSGDDEDFAEQKNASEPMSPKANKPQDELDESQVTGNCVGCNKTMTSGISCNSCDPGTAYCNACWDQHDRLSSRRRGTMGHERLLVAVCDSCEDWIDVKITSYCNACSCTFCDDCWPKQPPHKKNKRMQGGGAPHEKNDKRIADTINQILQPILTPEQLRQLHIQDRETKWFGITRHKRKDTGDPATQDDPFVNFGTTKRLQQLLDPICPSSSSKYPSIVSFVGETGAGKSTLIRALIETGALALNRTDPPKQTPVVGTALDGTRPCSGDVHLYADPRTASLDSTSDMPILFADCEGIRGGNITPTAERSWRGATKHKGKTAGVNTVLDQGKKVYASGRNKLRKLRDDHAPDEQFRKVEWAIGDKEKQTRRYAVDNIYPRFLYAFSDTIVFVTKNAKIFEIVLEQLVSWAEVALESSSNQPTLPSVLIVLNAVDNNVEELSWNTEHRTSSMFEDINEVLKTNDKFRQLVKTWKADRQKTITSVKELVLSYYSDVKVISVPEKGRPTLINQQIDKIYEEIGKMSEAARIRKKAARMCLTYRQLLPYLNYAFDHFARYEKAFNFVDVAFSLNPVREDFEDGIVQLLNAMLRCSRVPDVCDLSDKSAITEATKMIASAIMLDSTRNSKIGTAEVIFPNYLPRLEKAFDVFTHEYYPCQFAKSNKLSLGRPERCVIVRSRHSNVKGHQSEKGKILGQGGFQSVLSSLGSENEKLFFKNTFDCIYGFLQGLLVQLASALEGAETSQEGKVAGRIHQDVILAPFFKKFSQLQSNALCLTCLADKPKFPLPCLHSICESCLKCFGTTNNRFRYRLESCPICSSSDASRAFKEAAIFHVTPKEVSPCVLTLDGGGVRGIVQLQTLQQIEKVIGLGIPIREFFDVIVGTSCGGIIALGLGLNRWSVDRCTTEFKSFSAGAFKKTFGTRMGSPFGMSRFDASTLEKILQTIFGDQPMFTFAHSDGRSNGRSIAVAITATAEGGEPVVFGNYNRRENGKRRAEYTFFRPVDPESELRVWEAARATSAAPTFFDPFVHKASKLVLQDGALSFNNPVEVAEAEWKKIMPGPNKHSVPDVLLSIGTGFTSTSNSKSKLRKKFLKFIPGSHLKHTATVFYNKLEQTMNPNNTWDTFIRNHERIHPESARARKYKMFRLNVKLDSETKISDHSAIPELERQTLEVFSNNQKFEIRMIANRLIASLFYFHLEGVTKCKGSDRGKYICKGNIRCRLQFRPKSRQRLALDFTNRLPGAKFVLETTLPDIGGTDANHITGADRQTIMLTPDDIQHISRADTDDLWQKPVEIKVYSKDGGSGWQTKISLATNDEHLGLISAFPRNLIKEDRVRRNDDAKLAESIEKKPESIRSTGLDTGVSQAAHSWHIPSGPGFLNTRQLSQRFKSYNGHPTPRLAPRPVRAQTTGNARQGRKTVSRKASWWRPAGQIPNTMTEVGLEEDEDEIEIDYSTQWPQVEQHFEDLLRNMKGNEGVDGGRWRPQQAVSLEKGPVTTVEVVYPSIAELAG
ncbi:hypothetical protein BJ508DRAFT_411946 [Ascobolus immersus RN42]|uniref:PNPLA domain-containing protein n=1 Tax=Ascobolus immersus RN42 TaxID=1160509 RepID=A0A3N4IHB4_ASCIM|nr:hypothetical protein BJ508DRAFT_411946 [Ascobolus immersus RN42]